MEKVFADINIGTDIAPETLTRFKDFGSVINVVVMNAIILAAVICFIFLVLGGFSIIMGAGSGEPKKMEQGKKSITGAAIGLIVILLAVWIIQLIEFITGISLIHPVMTF